MSSSIDLMMLRLESQMFTRLCESCRVSNGAVGNVGGVSFADMLDNAVSGSQAASGTAGLDVTSSDACGMTVSDDMVKFIEDHEGFATTPYCGVDSWNRTTGYGHVMTGGESIEPLTQTGAENLLRKDLKTYEASVNKEFKGVKLTQGQFDSLVSFSYNLGANIWSSAPKLVSDIKSGASAEVIRGDFENCDHCGGEVVKGLLNRRDDEWKVYAFGDYI